MAPAVHLLAPGPGALVGRHEVGPDQLGGHDQVGLGVADQVLDYPFRFGVVALTEIRAEPIVQGQADIGRRGHHDVGHDAALQAAHPVGQHHPGHRPEGFEAAGQHLKGGRGALIGGKTHEPPTRKGHHSAEDVQAPLRAPVDGEHLAGGPHPRPAAPVVIGPPGPLGPGHQAPEVTGRARITSGCGRGQETFGGYAGRGLGHPSCDDVSYDVVVVAAGGAGRALGGLAEHGPLHCLVVDAADGGGSSETAQVVIGSDDVHAFPLRLQWSVLRVVGADQVPTP